MRGVGHNIPLEWLDKSNARVFAAAAVRPKFVTGFRLQRNSQSFHAHRVARLVEPHARDADPRVIALRDQARKKIELAVATASRSRVQHALKLQRIIRLRLHNDPEAL